MVLTNKKSELYKLGQGNMFYLFKNWIYSIRLKNNDLV